MPNQTLSPTDQLKLQRLSSFIETKKGSIYLISVDTQKLYRLFVEFLKDRTDEESFTLHKLYNQKSLEESIDTIQFNRDSLLADSKIDIFLVDSNGWNAFVKREKVEVNPYLRGSYTIATP